MSDPIEGLKTLVARDATLKGLVNILDRVRRIDESPVATLERLIKERWDVVQLLQAHPEARHDHDDFDFDFKYNFGVAVRKYMDPSRPPVRG